MLHRRFIVVIASAALFMAAFAQNARAHDEPVVGSLVGAGIGAAVAGPPGAAVGAIIGAAFGSHTAHESDHGRHAHRHARREVRHEVRHYEARAQPVAYAHPAEYARPVRYASANGSGNGNGYSEAACPPSTRVVYVEQKPKAVTRTKMKRVCKMVPVREVVASR